MFTDKEIQVMKLRKKGLTQVQVAEELNISQAAVSIFEKKIKDKLDKAMEAIRIARGLGL